MVRQGPFGVSVPWVLRLVLFAALVLGVVTMHTLGHPGGGHGGHESAVAVQHDHPVVHDMSAGEQVHASADGLDPMAVCLAVLVGWTVLLLVAGPLLRRSGDAAADVRARLLSAVRALPPPGGGRILLTRLSVLRQ